MNNVKIVCAEETHVDEVVEIWKQFMDYHQDLDALFTRSKEGPNNFRGFFLSLLENEEVGVFTALTEDKIIGYTIAQKSSYPPVFIRKQLCLITDIVIIPQFRGYGCGYMLFDKVKNWAKEKGLDRIELLVHANNQLGLDFYKKLGMETYMHKMFLEI